MTDPSRRKRLLLINPINTERRGFSLDRSSRYPPIGLAIVAALTPADWYIRIIDENFTNFRYRDADLVALTAFTSNVARAYEIAAVYREKGIPTVIGGIHASMMPEEAGRFVDTVVIGEAESSWPQLILDFIAGQMKPIYSGGFIDLRDQPLARHDLLHPAYVFSSVQTSRGCPFNCEFCTVSSFNGIQYRERPVEQVLEELMITPKNNLFFVDDNICGYGKRSRERAITLFREMTTRRIRKKWFSQASLNFADDDELLHWAAKSGCRLMLIGIEVETEAGLREFNKKLNLKKGVDHYETAFRKIQKHGISVLGSFIFGLDTDSPEDLRNRFDYIRRSRADAMQTAILTPLPGTAIYRNIIAENRLLANQFPGDWCHYHAADVVFQPAKMDPRTLSSEVLTGWKKIYSMKSLVWRFIRTLIRTRNPGASTWAFMSNYHYRNIVFEKKISVFPRQENH